MLYLAKIDKLNYKLVKYIAFLIVNRRVYFGC